MEQQTNKFPTINILAEIELFRSTSGLETNKDGSLTASEIDNQNRLYHVAEREKANAAKKLRAEQRISRLRELPYKANIAFENPSMRLKRIGVVAGGLVFAGILANASMRNAKVDTSQVNAILAHGPVTTEVTVRKYNEVEINGNEQVEVHSSPVDDDTTLVAEVDPGTRFFNAEMVAPSNISTNASGTKVTRNVEYWIKLNDCRSALQVAYNDSTVPAGPCYIPGAKVDIITPTKTP